MEIMNPDRGTPFPRHHDRASSFAKATEDKDARPSLGIAHLFPGTILGIAHLSPWHDINF